MGRGANPEPSPPARLRPPRHECGGPRISTRSSHRPTHPPPMATDPLHISYVYFNKGKCHQLQLASVAVNWLSYVQLSSTGAVAATPSTTIQSNFRLQFFLHDSLGPRGNSLRKLRRLSLPKTGSGLRGRVRFRVQVMPLNLSSPPVLKSIAGARYDVTRKEEPRELKNRAEQHRRIL